MLVFILIHPGILPGVLRREGTVPKAAIFTIHMDCEWMHVQGYVGKSHF